MNLEEEEYVDEEFVEELMHCVESSYLYQEEGVFKATEHEEKVHVICEPDQSVYLGEDDGDVDERSTKDIKDFFAGTYQHEELNSLMILNPMNRV